MILSSLLIASALLSIIWTIVTRGLPAVSLSMLTQTPKGGFYLGKEGGILNAITGSLCLAGGATLLSILISLPIVMYLNLYSAAGSRLVSVTRFSLDVLWGIPSIVYGAFGFTLMLYLGLKTSLLAGIITLTLLILPVMARAMDEVVRMIPRDLIEASYSLGATQYETAFHIVTRQVLPGLLTAVLIAFGRGIGDAASILFTAGFTDHLPSSLLRPAASLPLSIFFQLGTPFPEVRNRAYASAFILTVIILLICGLSRILTRKLNRNIIR